MAKNLTYEQNMEFLEKRDSKLAGRVRAADKGDSFKIIRSKTGYPNVIIEKGFDAEALYDNSDPLKYCRQYLKSLDIKYAPIVIFMGLGLGYHLNLFFKEYSKRLKTEEIVIFEENIGLFRLALELGDFRKIISHSNIHLFVGEDPETAFPKLRTEILLSEKNRIVLRSVKIIPVPASILQGNEYYLRALKTVKDAARQVMITAGNDPFDSLVGLENMFKNLEDIISSPGLNLFHDRFKGRPGILVAAGPSLNKNMHLLKDLRDRALIISCDASFIPLMKNGIRPHLVTSLERTPGVDLFYSGVKDFQGTYFVACPVLMPEVFSAFKGEKIIAYRAFSHFDWLENEKGSLSTGMSVANMAFKILEALECDPVILVGQDLAYSEEGDTHVEGNIFGERSEGILQKPTIMLEGNDGRPVRSERQWEIMKNTYEEDLEAWPGKCINATEGGARIRGAEAMTLNEAIRKYCTEEFRPELIIKEVFSDFERKNVDVEGELKRIRRKAIETRKTVRVTINKFKEALKDARLAEKEIIRPFIDKGSAIDTERLLDIEKKFLELSKTLNDQRDRKLFDITAHTVQPYDTWFTHELSFLKDIYTDKDCLPAATVLKMKEWFAVIGHLLVCTEDVLKKTEKELGEEVGAEIF
ncbi:MAG: motility associated factor glycosyltransferase family protein [Deltaproteobacteria bacterium]|nr:motility associated factor glycosyltransferase family protein [Deltaproteobacteria bacterium]